MQLVVLLVQLRGLVLRTRSRKLHRRWRRGRWLPAREANGKVRADKRVLRLRLVVVIALDLVLLVLLVLLVSGLLLVRAATSGRGGCQSLVEGLRIERDSSLALLPGYSRSLCTGSLG